MHEEREKNAKEIWMKKDRWRMKRLKDNRRTGKNKSKDTRTQR